MNWFGISSIGTYPTPTPTDAQRAIFAVSYGLLSLAPSSANFGVIYGLYRCGMALDVT